MSKARESIQFESNRILLNNQQFQFLSLFQASNSLSLEQIAKSLWQEEYSESHYHRIRMLTYKINKLAQKEFGFDLFVFRKTGVSLKSFYRIS